MEFDYNVWAGPAKPPSPEELAERHAIGQLAAIYGLGIDMRDYELCRSAFSADGVGIGRNGPEPFDEYLANTYELASSFHATQHLIANQYIHRNGEEANVWSYGIAHHKVAEGEERDEIIAGVQYRDKCKKFDEGWLIVERSVHTLWLDMRPRQ